ncbi:DUF4870 domain-containing protein [Candidatus Woesearchaeota archaeon]|nr:DUF4870 domain-containing protein [Candidatus Woesearchaeota archaeon]
MAHEHRTPIAALSYVLIGIIWYFVDEEAKKDQFVRFHVHQGVVFLIAAVVWGILLQIVLGVLGLVFGWIFGIGALILLLVGLLSYVPLIFLIIGIINVLNGKERELPLIGHWARRFRF